MNLRCRLPVLSLICFIAAITALPATNWAQRDESAAQPSDLEQRLALLAEKLEERRQQMNIPGMAIAVIKDGRLIMARGFGVSDIDSKKEVTPETLFAIGSSTKAFTATLIGMLADEGKMQFDDPVTRYVPEFKMQVETGDQEITFRDLLCHRTGFSRMGVLWAAAKDTSRLDVLGYAANAKPTRKFREAFQYNNVMYMTAGYAAGQAAGSTWEELIESKLLKPLGMVDSNTSITTAQQDDRLSRGYVWDEEKREYKLLPMRNLDLIGPAGSINSNVNDMAKWVQFQLAKGEIAGQRLIKEETLEETWEPQIEMGAGGGSYGLGWMIQDWNNQKVVQHGGNIDGFAAQVSILTGENLGYVLLANVTATPLQQGSIGLVFDTLLEDLPPAGEELSVDTTNLVGTYEGNLGAINGLKLKVLMKNGKLAVDIPGQSVFVLKNPDEQGKWYFELTDAIAVSFATDEQGDVIGLVVHQGGMDIECPREGVKRPIEYPLEKMMRLLGTYRSEEDQRDIQIEILNNRLVANTPLQGKVEFFPPDEQGKWAMRANREWLQIRFNEDEKGNIVSLTRFERGKQHEIKRVEKSQQSQVELPTAEQVLESIFKAHGLDDSHDPGTIRMTGTANFVNQGAVAQVEMVFTGAQAFYTKIELGKLGYIRESSEGERAWSDSAFAPFEEITGKKMIMAKLRHPIWFARDWQKYFEGPVVTEVTVLGDTEVVLLRFVGKEIPDRTLYVDAATGQILKEDWASLVPAVGQLPVEVTYSDYRRAGSITMPYKISMTTAGSGELAMQFHSAVQLDDRPRYNWSRDSK